jgi:hypothetical protein
MNEFLFQEYRQPKNRKKRVKKYKPNSPARKE